MRELGDKTLIELHLLRMLETHVRNPQDDARDPGRWERDRNDILRRLDELRAKHP